MTILYCDGFDTYPLITERWNVLVNTPSGGICDPVASPARTGGFACRIKPGSGNPTHITRAFTPHATITCQFAHYRANATQDVWGLNVSFYGDNGATQHNTFNIMNNGTVEVRRGASNATVIGTTTGFVTQQDAWNHIGLKATLSDTVGVIQVWINGNLALNLSTQDTKNAGTNTTYDAIRFFTKDYDVAQYIDDLVILNGAGSVNNSFIGDVQVLPRIVTGAGDRTELTPVGSATNYQNVDEARHNATDYNVSATNGAADLYALQDVAAGATILGVQQVTYAAKSEPASKSLAGIVKSAGTEYPQTAQSIAAVAFQPMYNQYELDPATGAPWTVANFNTAQFGVEVRA